MKFVAKSISLAVLALVTTAQTYAQPLRSTAIPSDLADDEKRLMPEVMTKFYGTFDGEKACWKSTYEDATYCMKPIRLDVRSSTGRKMLFIVAGGQQVDEEGHPLECDPCNGVLGLIVLTPNGANLRVVATNDLYEEFEAYGRYPDHNSVTVHRLGSNGAYGWVAELGYDHSGVDQRWVQVYHVIGHSVTLLTTIMSYYSNAGACDPADAVAPCTALSVKYAFETHSSANSFYPIILRVSGIKNKRPFRGNYRLVFDMSSHKYLSPKNMPDEIKRILFMARPRS
jgi:hypothetical protein